MRSRPLGLALAQLAVAMLALGAVEIALVVAGPIEPAWALVLSPVVAWVYVAVGIGAWLRRPSNRMGALMIAAGLLWLGAGLVNTDVPALVAVGLVVATAPLAVVIHMLLGLPSGRLRDNWSRATVTAGYAVALVLQAPLYLFAADPPPFDVLQVADRPTLLDAGLWTQRGAGILVVAATAAILASRIAHASRRQRRALAPLAAYGIVVLLFIPVSANVLPRLVEIDVVTLVALQLSVLAVVPIAFECAVLLGGFARTAELEELGAWLGTEAEGLGLRTLADRVDVVGGRLTVGSPPGGGTRIVAEVPCAS